MFFIEVLTALILLNELEGVVKGIFALAILLALLLFSRRARELDLPTPVVRR